jgi:hypothetical protein
MVKESKIPTQLEAYGFSALMTVSTVLNLIVLRSFLEKLITEESTTPIYAWEVPLLDLYMAFEKQGLPEELIPLFLAGMLTLAGAFTFHRAVEATKKI